MASEKNKELEVKNENKILLKTFLISGLTFALGMAGFYYLWEDGSFQLWRFLFHFITFGAVMGILARKNYRKKQKELESNE